MCAGGAYIGSIDYLQFNKSRVHSIQKGWIDLSETILYEQQNNGITILTLNRPNVANALNNELLQQLSHYIEKIKNDESVRCVILTANGEKAFCAGADLKERKGLANDEVMKAVSTIRNTITKLEELPQPIIAAINGVAFGGGLELALACDIRIASTTASFGLTETSLGIIPGAGGTQRLPRIIGVSKAKELIYTAARISSAEAEKIGLVSYAVDFSQVMDEALRIADLIVQNGPIAVIQAKKAINSGMDADLQAALAIEEDCYRVTIPTNDRIEGLQAFAEKRKPQYKGN